MLIGPPSGHEVDPHPTRSYPAPPGLTNTKDLDLRWIQLKRDYAAGVFNPAEWEAVAEGFDFISFENTAASVRARMAFHELQAVLEPEVSA
ncbi:MAG: hypothetical protein R6W48_05910 [Gaiellaceae bacterium]